MSNPFSGMNNMPMPGPFGNMQRMMQQFQNFRNTMGNINPQQTVMNMVNSGAISQQQLNAAQQMARQFQNLLK